MDDSISRQAALEKMKYYHDDCAETSVYTRLGFETAMEVIKSLPSTDRPMGWIPVSERLPEDHKDVLICLSSDQICIGCYNSHRLPFSNNAIGWGASYMHNWCSNDVIAWMPLPKAYKAESEDE